MRPIQLVDLHNQYLRIKTEVDRAIGEVLDSTVFIGGKHVEGFSRDLESYLGVGHVIPCANGTDALQIALMAIDCRPGDEIITPSFTYVATCEVIALLGLTPVFVDVDPHTFTIDIADVKQKISKKTKAIIPVHLYGQGAQMDELMQIAEEHQLYVVEDTAQALGSNYTSKNGKVHKLGTIGHIGTTSFFPSKNLGCYGDGGALMTNDESLAAKIRMIANHGQSKRYYHDMVGVNSRLDHIQAAVLRIKLRHLNEYIAARNRVADAYDEAFSAIDEIATPKRAAWSDHGFHQYTIKLTNTNRADFQQFLAGKGIPTNIYYPVPVHLQKGYTQYGYKKGDLPITEKLAEEVLSLPIHTEMDDDQLEYITDQINTYFSKK